ncbi:GNAT family N-acetyltransferase [Dictyobacter aurantiacus]|uniref:Putative N-acetyltransferase YuaI n=1 Tax=Dictyobacter aurantiacus TaxID=1936993 RepID=A0A401ZH70_9CHLR|nr:GNAT family N-acetyltransferase [Dictyobacter aurantiacus]GCE06234.1 putative N-acetyltransferase YuaI [Dictyobacter aurantiacus]
MVTIRPATLQDVEGLTHVQVDTWRTTYRGLIPDDYLAGLTYEPRQLWWTQVIGRAGARNFVFVAVDEAGQVVGFISGGPERSNHAVYKSELYAIYILANQHGQGIGRELVRVLARSLIQAGFSSMLVWVLDGNPAQHFYQRLGGQYVASKPEQIGGADLEEIAYGWSDLHVLL